jgi:hypothetical protein
MAAIDDVQIGPRDPWHYDLSAAVRDGTTLFADNDGDGNVSDEERRDGRKAENERREDEDRDDEDDEDDPGDGL